MHTKMYTVCLQCAQMYLPYRRRASQLQEPSIQLGLSQLIRVGSTGGYREKKKERQPQSLELYDRASVDGLYIEHPLL